MMDKEKAYDELLKVFDTTPDWITHLKPKKGDVLVVRTSVSQAKDPAFQAIMAKFAREMGVFVLWGVGEFDISLADEAEMNKHGWYSGPKEEKSGASGAIGAKPRTGGDLEDFLSLAKQESTT